MHVLNDVVNYILTFKPYVLLPIILFVFSVLFRMKPSDALKASLTIGIGFIGIFVIFGYFVENIGPAIEAMVNRTGLHFNVLDVGWPSLAAAAWSYKLAPLLMVLILAVNILMLVFKLTKTVNIDIWNFWHMIFVGALVYETTGSVLLSIAATLAACIIIIKLADWCAPAVNKFGGLSGITITTLSASAYLPLGLLGNSILDRIPYINKINASPEAIKKKIGLLGEPMIIGFIIGTLLGVVSGYDIKKVLELGFSIAAVIYILPMMAGVLGKGIVAISESMKEFLKKKLPGMGETYIGLDVAVIVGNTSVIVTGLILIPIALLLAFILPGVKFVPLGDLANIMGAIPLIVIAARGNVVRSVIICVPVIIGKLYVASSMAAAYTSLVHKSGLDLNGYKGPITSFLDGGNLFRFWIVRLFEGNRAAILLAPLILFLLYYTARTLSKTPIDLYDTSKSI